MTSKGLSTPNELIIQEVSSQATTTVLVSDLTDQLLQFTRDMLVENYELFMQIAFVLCSVPLKRSALIELLNKVIRQKDRIWTFCDKLKPERAAL